MRCMAGDLRHALRMIVRNRGPAFVVVLSLGAGIGVNAAIFSWFQGRLLQPLPGVAGSAGLHGVEPRTETARCVLSPSMHHSCLRNR